MNSPSDLMTSDVSDESFAGPEAGSFAAEHGSMDDAVPHETSSPSSVADTLLSIPVTLQVVIGTARLSISRVAELKRGAIVNLDQKLGTPATILINGKEVARGDLFVLEGEDARLGITVREVIPISRR